MVSQRTNLGKLRRICFQQTQIPPNCLVLSIEPQRQFGHRERDSSADVSRVSPSSERNRGLYVVYNSEQGNYAIGGSMVA